MTDVLLKDDWKQESKAPLVCLILFTFIGVTVTIVFYFRHAEGNYFADTIKMSILFGLIVCCFLYVYLYCILYKIEVYQDKIIRKSLFGTKEYLFKDIQSYSFDKYSERSKLYKFILNINGKQKKIYTHFAYRLDAIFKECREV